MSAADSILTSLNSINLLRSIEATYWLKYYIIASCALLFMLLSVVFFQRKKSRLLGQQRNITNNMLQSIKPDQSLEKNLVDLLGLIISLVEADGYYFYIFDSKSDEFILKVVRHNERGGADIAPSYSGLVPYGKEKYDPPLTIPASAAGSSSSIVNRGKVPMLVLPINKIGLINIGPVQKIPKGTMALLNYASEALGPLVEIVVEMETIKNQIETTTASSKAIQSLTKSSLGFDASISTLLGLGIGIVGAAGGSLLYQSESRLEAAMIAGLEKETYEQFNLDEKTHELFLELVWDRPVLFISKESKEYGFIPNYLADAGFESLLLLKVETELYNGTAVFWYPSIATIDNHRIAALQLLTQRMGEALDSKLTYNQLSNSYLDTLKTLVSAVDNMEPYTVSHSELISRYAGIIAREMDLNNKDIADVMLAGHLHDIGMLALSGDILFKDGKYSKVELENMKLHSEIGASIIESTIDRNNVAAYIRHHHERWDGHGYPSGLKGEEIPLGARILAVVDMFNAKLTGRKYREPLPFERVISDLRAAGETQLDSRIVEVFIGWFSRKQRDSSRRGLSLGNCWEMKCCSVNTASTCPAYQQTEKNCWEIRATKCEEHGNVCASCPVRTEFLFRNENTVEIGG